MKTLIIDLIYKLLGKNCSCRLGRSLYLRSRFEVDNNMDTNGELFVQRAIMNSNPGGVIFDIGANYGEWTKKFNCNVKPFDKKNFEIHTFEPCESNFIKNVNNLASCNNIEIINNNIALSSDSGNDKMYIGSSDTGSYSLHEDLTLHNYPTFNIQKDTIVSYCRTKKIDKILFAKCDTEGHDYEVIKGGYNMFLDEKIMAFQFEYNLRWIYSKHFLKDVFDLFVGLPYRIGKISRDKIYFYETWHPELERFFEGNYLIAHTSCINLFPHHSGKFDDYYVYKFSTEDGLLKKKKSLAINES